MNGCPKGTGVSLLRGYLREKPVDFFREIEVIHDGCTVWTELAVLSQLTVYTISRDPEGTISPKHYAAFSVFGLRSRPP